MPGLDDPYAVPDPNAPSPTDYPPFPPQAWGFGNADAGPQLPIPQDVAAQAAAPPPEIEMPATDLSQRNALEDPNAPGPAPLQPGLGGVPVSAIDQVTPQLPPNRMSDDEEREQQVYGDLLQPIHVEPPTPPPPPSPEDEAPQAQQMREGRENAQGIEDEANRLAADPEKLAEQDFYAQEAKDSEARRQKMLLAHQEEARVQQDWMAHRARIAKVQADSDRIVADANDIANTKVDPQGYMHGRSAFQTIVDVIGGALGGAIQRETGGQNIYINQLNKKIDQDIAAQNANIANRWKGIGVRQTANEQDLSREADQYRENEAYRQGVYQRAQNDIDVKMQDFDPRSSTVRKLAHLKAGIASQAQASFLDFQKKQDDHLKAVYDRGKVASDIYKVPFDVAKTQAETDKIRAETAGLHGKGVGGIAGPAPGAPKGYPHQLNAVFDPFTQQPMFAQHPLKDTQENELRGKATAYRKAQDAMAELDAIGKEGGYDKDTIAEKLGAGSPIRRRFDQARAALMSALSEGRVRGSMGNEEEGKSGSGGLGLLEQMVPNADGWIARKAGADPAGDLKAMEERFDRAFEADFNSLGVKGSDIIDHAKGARQGAATPSTRKALADDARGLVDSPSPDMEAATEATRKRIEGEETRKQQGGFARQLVKVAHPVTDLPETGSADDIARAKVVNAVGKELNDRLAAYNAKPDKDRTDDDAIGTANAMRAYAQAVNDLMIERHERAVKRAEAEMARHETSDQSLIERGIR